MDKAAQYIADLIPRTFIDEPSTTTNFATLSQVEDYGDKTSTYYDYRV